MKYSVRDESMNSPRETLPQKDGTTEAPLPNKGLDLTNPDAAQSVPVGPLCLLSGLAAQAHVGQANRAQALDQTQELGYS